MILNDEEFDAVTASAKCVGVEEKTEETPEISIVIPVYNVEDYLEETLDSVINQTFRDTEILCIDDGSTDGSAEILRKYALKDSRIRILSKENEGVGKARNIGIDSAKGKYIYFLDSDDLLDSRTLEICFETAEENGLDIVLFEGEAFYESKELEEVFPGYKTLYHRKKEYPHTYSGRELYILLSENWDCFTHICMKLYRKSYIKENRIYFPENIYYEDEIFNIKSMLHAGKVKVLTQTLYKRRVRGNSIMTHADDIYKRYASYHECACLILDYIASMDFNYETVRCLAFRVFFFLESADKFYQNLDAESKNAVKGDPAVRSLDFTLLKPALESNKHAFFRSAKEFECLKKEIESIHSQVKTLNEENTQYCKELQELYKEIDTQCKDLQNLYKENDELRKEIQLLSKDRKKKAAKIIRLENDIKEKKAKNSKLKKANEKYEARLKVIDEGAIVVRMDKRVVRILKGIKRKIKRLLRK